MIKVIGLDEKDGNALAKLMRNILGVEDLVVVITNHLIRNPGLWKGLSMKSTGVAAKCCLLKGKNVITLILSANLLFTKN